VLPDWAPSAPVLAVLAVVAGLTLRVVALGVIPGNRKPSTGMAWLLLVLLSPILGLVAFALFGSARLESRRHARQQRVIGANAAGAGDLTGAPTSSGVPQDPVVRSLVTLNQNLGALPLTSGNDVDVIEDYSASLAAMTAAVDEAEHRVHVEFYITAWDDVTAPLFDALVRATERGVAVRLLFDHLGSRGIPGYRDMLRRLEGTAIEWHQMLTFQPLRRRVSRPDLRNHRKLLVVDGRVGFTGSQNLTEPGYNKPKNHALGRAWVELIVRVRGPVVATLDAVFAGDWYAETGEALHLEPQPLPVRPVQAGAGDVACQVVPSGPGYGAENNLRLFTTLIYAANERASLTSPYSVPDESLLSAVTTAARRGVEVELFVSEVADQFMVGHAQASYYRALLDSGVRIYRYPAPWILHSKHLTVDDSIAVVGSSNMDMRSFALNYEISLMMLGADIVQRLRHVEDHYRALSQELSLEKWSDRPARVRYVDNVMRLTAALQ
jgi:cardiolipin synthase